ncbi:MAG TPA: aldose epimerase family protein [Candidatus Angelobacter sp.]|nr:aldose epimerase family protein [Candidatus Angelobacter sp.]
MPAKISKSNFGHLPDGTPVEQYTLTNSQGAFCKIITLGGVITELQVPERNGKLGDVVVGFDNLEQYLGPHPYFGAICGRYSNRIAKGKFTLEGKAYSLAINNGPNHLHGGLKGFDKVAWKATPGESKDGATLKLTYTSADGEEGYPGNLKVAVTYTWTEKNELRIDYEAVTDKTTPINLTNHSYFNLAGGGDALGHELTLMAASFTPTDDTLIPTGEIKSVKDTPFDFMVKKTIGKDMEKLTALPHRGYDHNFVLDNYGKGLALAGQVREPKSGRVMEVMTDQPGVQLYTANYLEDTRCKEGRVFGRNGAFCLETQHFPDSVNHSNFPSTILRPGETYRTTTIYRFLVG